MTNTPTAVTTLPVVGAQRDFSIYDRAHPGLFLGPKFLTVRSILARGDLDVGLLGRALEHLAATQEVLRVRFVPDPDSLPGVAQEVQPAVPTHVEVVDWTDRGDVDLRMAQEAVRDFFATTEYPVDRPPLFGVRVYRLAPRVAVICLGFHHMIIDGEGAEVSARLLFAAYDALADGQSPPERKGWTWSEYCLTTAQRNDDPAEVARAQDFWRGFFADGVETGFPVDPPARPELSGVAGVLHRPLDTATAAGIEHAARSAGTLLGAYSASVFGRFLAKQLGRDQVTFFFTQTARVPARLHHLPGLMLLLLAARTGASTPARDAARSVQEHIVRANRHAALSGALLRTLSRPDPDDAERFRTREVAIAFQLIPSRPVPTEAGGLTLETVSRHGEDHGSSPCSWLEFHFCPGGEPHLLCRYDSGRFDPDQAEGFLDALVAELTGAAVAAPSPGESPG